MVNNLTLLKRIFEGEDLGTMFLPSDENLSDKNVGLVMLQIL